ncbi:hypothetical protein AAHC03_016621 [Spirometra sp. Aus1]
MEYNKLNVFHWHLSDDQSFPFQSQMFPELSKKAAFRQDLVYTLEDARQIVEFARVRGIRVIPEFDLPGHARSWAYAHPEIVTRCYDNGLLTQFFGPLDPTRQETYAILQGFFTELVQVFPDLYIHLGFDEFELGCWDSNPRIQNYMRMNNIDSSLSLLKHFHIRQVPLPVFLCAGRQNERSPRRDKVQVATGAPCNSHSSPPSSTSGSRIAASL